MTGLLDWLDDPAPGRGIRFAEDDGGWSLSTYEEIARASHQAAYRLAEAGVKQGQLVSLVIPTGPVFVPAYFGTLLLGATPAPLVPPTLFERPEEYIEHTSALMGQTDLTVTQEELLPLVTSTAERAGLATPPLVLGSLDDGSGEIDRAPQSELALVQFTSGSSGRPRGVRVTHENLVAMIDYIFEWVPWGPDEAGAHWLPLYHDFGLIGCLLAPITRGRDLWIMRPDQFIRWPERWIACFGREGAAFNAAPTFAFSYAAKKVDPALLEGMDFSRWRGAIIGAERLDPAVLDRFATMLEPYGFRRETFQTAYGMAEATLGVTGLPAGELAAAVRPDWGALRFGEPVAIEERSRLGDPRIENGADWLVSCGRPHEGLTIRVVDEAGSDLPEGSLGELVVTGPTVAPGYLGEATAATSFDDDGLHTGDAGFMVDGELYMVGRIGDAIKVRGKTLYAEDLEAKLCAIDGVPRGRCVVIPSVSHSESSLVAIVEAQAGDWTAAATRLLAREAGESVAVEVLTAPPGTIKRTSSGKPRRRVMWRALIDGELPVAEPPRESAPA